MEYGFEMNVGTVSQYRTLAELSDESLNYMRTACIEVPGVSALKANVYWGHMSKSEKNETKDRVSSSDLLYPYCSMDYFLMGKCV